MAKVITGRATLMGADGDIAWTGEVAGTVKEPQAGDYSHDNDILESKDANGEVDGLIGYNDSETLTLTILPKAGTSSNNTLAKAAAAIELPTKLAVITLSNFSASVYNGTWNYIGGGKINKSNTGLISMTLPLKRFGGAGFATISA